MPVSPLASLVLKGNPKKSPLVILHGLFGSKQNWQTFAKALFVQEGRPIHALDLRNHGDSPHHDEMTYEAMASDVQAYFKEQQLVHPILMGHSMGGKVALSTALLAPETVKGVISIDMSPLEGTLSDSIDGYLRAMLKLELTRPRKLSAADDFLAKFIKEESIRKFLLTNLKPLKGTDVLQFRIPLSTIQKTLPNLNEVPKVPSGQTYPGPVFIIGASRASYVKEDMLPAIHKQFPKAQIEMMDAGHWIHAEQPLALLEKIKRMLAFIG